MKVFLQCCDCGGVRTIEGCVPEVRMEEETGTRTFMADGCGGMRRSQLTEKFGATDVEHIALKLYRLFHGEDERDVEDGWTPYKKYGDDYVVQKFRNMAQMVQAMHRDMRFGGR
jgi:hypothetical protein